VPRRPEPDPLALKVGARIRDLRLEQKLSIAQLAKKSGLSKGHLSGIERGLSIINLGTIDKLAKALGLELFDIVTLPETSRRAALLEKQRLESVRQEDATEPAGSVPVPRPRRRSR
jgi:transcriptional regulator with XRE-family HTH domain